MFYRTVDRIGVLVYSDTGIVWASITFMLYSLLQYPQTDRRNEENLMSPLAPEDGDRSTRGTRSVCASSKAYPAKEHRCQNQWYMPR